MAYVIEEIKENIKLHLIKTDKFKTNLLSVFLTVPLDRKTVTGNAIIPAVLRRGTAKLKAQDEISKERVKELDIKIKEMKDKNQNPDLYLGKNNGEERTNRNDHLQRIFKGYNDFIFKTNYCIWK